jgi:hypothetical protein
MAELDLDCSGLASYTQLSKQHGKCGRTQYSLSQLRMSMRLRSSPVSLADRPETLDLEDVRAFQVHSLRVGCLPVMNQTVCALRFLYGVSLHQAELPERFIYVQNRVQNCPVLECAPLGGQFEVFDLPALIGLQENRSHRQASNPQFRVQNARPPRNSSPARRFTRCRNAATSRAN